MSGGILLGVTRGFLLGLAGGIQFIIYNIMRRMILTDETYKGRDEGNYQKKLKEFDKIIKKVD